MSPLTKLFVVLLVIVSMLNAAAIVVFVNNAKPLQPMLDTANSQLQAARLQEQANLAAMQRAQDQLNAEIVQHQKDNSTHAAESAQDQADLNKAEVTIASLRAENTDLQASVNTANGSVQLATSTANKSQDQLTELRNSNDDLVKQNEEFGRRNAELTSTLDSLRSRQEETAEKLQESKEDTEKLAAALKDKGVDPQEIVNATAPAGLGAQDINGVVREKSVINGNTFVTISVGSADGVTKGMKFNVVNGPEFLGIVTIDTVDTDSAIGRLEGFPDKVAEVQKGNDVKTQLRE